MDVYRIFERQVERHIAPDERRLAQFMLFEESSHPVKLIQRNDCGHTRIIRIVRQHQRNLPVLPAETAVEAFVELVCSVGLIRNGMNLRNPTGERGT